MASRASWKGIVRIGTSFELQGKLYGIRGTETELNTRRVSESNSGQAEQITHRVAAGGKLVAKDSVKTQVETPDGWVDFSDDMKASVYVPRSKVLCFEKRLPADFVGCVATLYRDGSKTAYILVPETSSLREYAGVWHALNDRPYSVPVAWCNFATVTAKGSLYAMVPVVRPWAVAIVPILWPIADLPEVPRWEGDSGGTSYQVSQALDSLSRMKKEDPSPFEQRRKIYLGF